MRSHILLVQPQEDVPVPVMEGSCKLGEEGGEEGEWTLFVCLQKLYINDMFECLLCYSIFNFDNISLKK